MRGLIVDWGGVLTFGVFGAFDAFCAAEGLPPGSIATAFRTEPARSLLAGFECGTIPPAEFEASLAAHHGVDSDDLLSRLFAGGADTLDNAMHDAVERFRAAGVRTALLSNSWGPERYDRSRWDAMFDAVVLSCDHAVRKPDPAIYEIVLREIGLPASECVFVDDIGGNLKPARALGMTTVRHTDAASTIEQLTEIFNVTVTQ
ncbi:HAD family phosphatase [Sporichthya sp.]|uniref:HAD family hydrolase n=1 Tax=Sporichthya sp. TaxID=65475 RepID=UPI0017DD0C16|nr:HAD family phosphatase [Sporichthya sp.]MBA3742470.1 HAD family phosphatase [Sporichthya sp.]